MGYLSNTARSYYSGTNLGNYQYLNLSEIIDNFTATYVGEGKILQGVLKGDVSFHAHRALAELTYDTLKSCKSQEITLPPSLVMSLPQDYINYTKITWSDDNGIEHVIYPASKTSNPSKIAQDPDGNYLYNDVDNLNIGPLLTVLTDEIIGASPAGTEFNYYIVNPHGHDGSGPPPVHNTSYARAHPLEVGMEIKSPHFPPGTKIVTVSEVPYSAVDHDKFTFTVDRDSINTATKEDVILTVIGNSNTWDNYSSGTTNTLDTTVDNSNYFTNSGERYGLDGQYAQANGSFFIDCVSGKIHFSSNLNGKTIILHYLSDSLGTDPEMVVPKLAEEAIYKWILYGCLVARAGVPAGFLAMAKKEKSAETRKAKIRLSNIKIEEITQVFRAKSKWIKH